MARGELKHYVPVFAHNLPILLVDNDPISLTDVASMLEQYSYHVTTAVSTSIALSMVREQKTRFKLVMAHVNFSDNRGHLFVRELVNEGIPVVLILSDNDVNSARRALAEGASFFLEKPISLSDLKNIWQHMFSRGTTGQQVTENQVTPVTETSSKHPLRKKQHNRKREARPTPIAAADPILTPSDIIRVNPSNSLTHTHTQFGSNKGNTIITARVDPTAEESEESSGATKYKKRRVTSSIEDDSEDDSDSSEKSTGDKLEKEQDKCGRKRSSKRRPRVVWTQELHFKFTAALSILGDERARPKTILEKMNVPYLTQRQVASHLQKYKAQVQRISEMAEADEKLPSSPYGRKESSNLFEQMRGPLVQHLSTAPNCFPLNNASITNLPYGPSPTFPPVPCHLINTRAPTFLDPNHHGAGPGSSNAEAEYFKELEAILHSESEQTTASIEPSSHPPTFGPAMETDGWSCTPTDQSLTDFSDGLVDLSEEELELLKGLCDEPIDQEDDDDQYTDWLADVLPEDKPTDG